MKMSVCVVWVAVSFWIMTRKSRSLYTCPSTLVLFIITSMLPVLCMGIQVCRQISMVWSPIGNKHFSFLSIELDYITIPLQCVAAATQQHAKRVLAPIEKFALTFWTQSSCFFKVQAFLSRIVWMLFICNSFHCQMRESIYCRSVNAVEPAPTQTYSCQET